MNLNQTCGYREVGGISCAAAAWGGRFICKKMANHAKDEPLAASAVLQALAQEADVPDPAAEPPVAGVVHYPAAEPPVAGVVPDSAAEPPVAGVIPDQAVDPPIPLATVMPAARVPCRFSTHSVSWNN